MVKLLFILVLANSYATGMNLYLSKPAWIMWFAATIIWYSAFLIEGRNHV